MNINIKNCEVNIITGTDTLEISGNAQPAAAEAPAESTRPAESKESGCISEMTYSVSAFMANRDKVRIGDRVKLPSFTVPAVKMDGDEVMEFDEKNIRADDAIVIGKDENGNFILIFDHCLFESAIDLNDEKRFEMTQLGQYLQSEFLRAMNSAEIPAESCGLISKEEMFGDNALEYFKTGRNRMAFDFDEDFSRYYWLSTLYDEEASAAHFCNASANGTSYCSRASIADYYVRPRFVISAIKQSAGLKMKELNKENEAMYETFCRSVKRICKYCGIAQKHLSAKIGISHSQFQNKVNNLGAKFNLLEMYKLSQNLCESIENLATGNI